MPNHAAYGPIYQEDIDHPMVKRWGVILRGDHQKSGQTTLYKEEAAKLGGQVKKAKERYHELKQKHAKAKEKFKTEYAKLSINEKLLFNNPEREKEMFIADVYKARSNGERIPRVVLEWMLDQNETTEPKNSKPKSNPANRTIRLTKGEKALKELILEQTQNKKFAAVLGKMGNPRPKLGPLLNKKRIGKSDTYGRLKT